MELKKKKDIPGGIQFLGAVIFLYGTAWIFNARFTQAALENFWQTFRQLFPILMLAFFVMFLVNLFVRKEYVRKHLGQGSGMKGIAWALLGSFVISGPPYVLFPYFKQLKNQGLRTALAAIFFNNRSMQPVFLPVLVHYFGAAFSVILFCYITIFSVLAGLLVEKVVDFLSENEKKSN